MAQALFIDPRNARQHRRQADCVRMPVAEARLEHSRKAAERLQKRYQRDRSRYSRMARPRYPKFRLALVAVLAGLAFAVQALPL